tara:strand:- start:90 stop:599 length:510 start_codon:yes stop_codon:yes gene_type:complete
MSKKEIQITTNSTSNIILASIKNLNKPFFNQNEWEISQEEKNTQELDKVKNSLKEINSIYDKIKYLIKRINFQNIHTAQIRGQILYNDKMRYVTYSFRRKHDKLNLGVGKEIFKDYEVQLKENRSMLNNWYDTSLKVTKKLRRLLEELRQQKNKDIKKSHTENSTDGQV